MHLANKDLKVCTRWVECKPRPASECREPKRNHQQSFFLRPNQEPGSPSHWKKMPLLEEPLLKDKSMSWQCFLKRSKLPHVHWKFQFYFFRSSATHLDLCASPQPCVEHVPYWVHSNMSWLSFAHALEVVGVMSSLQGVSPTGFQGHIEDTGYIYYNLYTCIHILTTSSIYTSVAGGFLSLSLSENCEANKQRNTSTSFLSVCMVV